MSRRFTQRQRGKNSAAWLISAAILLAGDSAAFGQAAPLMLGPANFSDQRVALQIAPPAQPTPTAQSSPAGQGTPAGQSTAAGQSTPASTAVPSTTVPGPVPAPTAAAPSTIVVPPATVVPQTVAPVIVEPVPVIPVPIAVPPTTVVQPTEVIPSPTPPAPLLDDGGQAEELLPPLEEEETFGTVGVEPYGGGHPTDWSWGCSGSPYRTNGRCDNWKVGCNWHVTVDGIVMSREEADLDALADEMEDNHQGAEDLENPVFEDFSHGPGGRITFMSQVPKYVGYQIQAVYEGIEAWNSSIVFEKEDFEPEFFTAVITTETVTDVDVITNGTPDTTVTTTVGPDGTTTTVTVTSDGTATETETETTTTTSYALGPIPLQPGDPFPEGFEQRSLHYRSNYHSGELNWVRDCCKVWRPYCGVRYIKFDDEINDFTNQEVQPPLPFEGPDNVLPGEFLAVASTDRLNLFDIENNLMGFQIGLIHDSWKVNRRFALEGFVNSGLYYNKIKYTNLMGIFTTQQIADDTSTVGVNEARIDFSDVVNNDVRELSEISYHAEASLSAVCRLNKCWALRAGVQGLWVANVHLAEDAYLEGETDGRSLLFHGWHAGVECRR
ncbi:MAG: hypothetical protein WD738_02270 [Pirellulales bacterium]